MDKLDGFDERYWDLVIGDAKLTLHLQHYFGITVYPTAGADANAESLAALEKVHGLLSRARWGERGS
ncbi:MAG TPA: hypothetical protein VFK05_06540 [Polyangiaceae bacterium]|nr:hypothetical protein [Polyangiaceae bacterium]